MTKNFRIWVLAFGILFLLAGFVMQPMNTPCGGEPVYTVCTYLTVKLGHIFWLLGELIIILAIILFLVQLLTKRIKK